MNYSQKTVKSAFVVVLIALLMACVGAPPTPPPPASAPKNTQASHQALRLYVFDCGSIDVADVSVFSPGVDEGQRKLLANSCYLIVHGDQTLLWDAGLSDSMAGKPGVTQDGFTLALKRSLQAQLQDAGYRLEDVDYIGFSHMHFDHTGNANLFNRATVLLQEEEYAAAFGSDPKKFHFDPATYSALKDNRVIKLNGDHDVFGDGRVIIKRSIGHTPGHQVLFVKLPRTGPVLLSGDLVHFTKNWEHKRVPSFNYDKKRSLQAMQDMEKFLAAEGAQLWIQHDFEQNTSIKHAPAYYD